MHYAEDWSMLFKMDVIEQCSKTNLYRTRTPLKNYLGCEWSPICAALFFHSPHIFFILYESTGF